MKFGVLAFMSVFLLSGCSGTSTLENQVNLLEYEKCLAAEEATFAAIVQHRTREEMQVFFDELVKEDPLVAGFITACKKYRP